MRKRLLPAFIGICILVFTGSQSHAQNVVVSGTVYDISAKRPLEAVAVMSTSGRGTITDSLGRYSILVPKKDSVWFSLIGKSTMKYPVDTIENMDNFNVMIHVYAAQLPEVKVRNNYYKLDSVQNRQEYAKYFNFKKPSLRLSTNPNYNPGGLTAGFDLDEIINMFRTRRNRNMAFLQKRLLDEEQGKYVDRRFSKPFVRKLTKLESPELEVFMEKYRPTYAMVTLLNELELGYYIQKCFEQYLSEKSHWKGGLRR